MKVSYNAVAASFSPPPHASQVGATKTDQKYNTIYYFIIKLFMPIKKCSIIQDNTVE